MTIAPDFFILHMDAIFCRLRDDDYREISAADYRGTECGKDYGVTCGMHWHESYDEDSWNQVVQWIACMPGFKSLQAARMWYGVVKVIFSKHK